MYILQKGRGWGKTTAILNLMAENDAIIYVAPTTARANAAWKLSRNIGLDLGVERFIAAGAIPSEKQRRQGKKPVYAMDDLSEILETMLGAPVTIATEQAPKPTAEARIAKKWDEER